MTWWAWMVLGIGLLGVEMFVIDAQFYLVFIGLSAAIVGLLGLFGVGLPNWAQWLVFSGLAVAAMFGFRRRLYELVRNRSGHVEERLTVGDRVLVPARLEPGQSGRVEYRGTSWTARNTGDSAIDAGREAVIAEVSGLTLHVKAE
ncbi:MAG TPA: NfeD family protein [Steroidobacteraceae bacterium]|nr:NfeD family protein [Steroidobacteraceae bacterium]